MSGSIHARKKRSDVLDAPREGDLAAAARVLSLERDALDVLNRSLDRNFSRALDVLAATEGRVIVTGMGKSGDVGKKIAATLASTGRPAFFVHPAEASHGDLGMIVRADSIIAISNSGETPELSAIIQHAKRCKIPLVVITSGRESSLAEQSDVALVLPPVDEACPMGLAPTTSTTMMMALGDALAVALMERRGFSAGEYQLLHPGGILAQRTLKVLRVADIMHKGEALPLTHGDTPMTEVLVDMTAKSLGCIGVVDGGKLAGIITDGDLRRHMANGLLDRNAGEVMTANPKTIRPGALASEAVQVMNDAKITNLFVCDEDGMVAGVLHIHDCLRAGVV